MVVMTGSPNPGGQNRRLIRTAVATWLTAQHIQGLDHVYRSRPPEVTFTEYVTGDTAYRCDAFVFIPEDAEQRLAQVGPALPTGKLVHYRVEIEFWHRVYELSEYDWDDAEDDYDRIIDSVKDALRASGRTLGRPDVVLAAGENRAGIVTRHALPELLDGGTSQRNGSVMFEVAQYL